MLFTQLPDFADNTIIDTRNGYAINRPLCYQAPAAFWASPTGAVIRNQVNQLRQQYGITIDDDLVTTDTDYSASAIDPFATPDD